MDNSIAILGATSHVAKNLIVGLAGRQRLSLFARSMDRVVGFLESAGIGRRCVEVNPLEAFSKSDVRYDAIVNCIGVGTPEKVRALGAELLFVTEQYDNNVLSHLKRNPETIYVNFSSGAVYGTDCVQPVDKSSEFRIGLDSISVADVYRISKLHAETKHRALSAHSIIDLRLFSLFSRFIDLTSSYLMTEMVNAIKHGTEFVTNDSDIIRDYVHPEDLCDLVSRCLDTRGINRAFDIYSRRPARKSEIISAFQERFGLKVRTTGGSVGASPTGLKSCYASNNRAAGEVLGYVPRHTSLDALLTEGQALLQIEQA